MIVSYSQAIITCFFMYEYFIMGCKKLDIVFWFLNESLRRYSVTQIYT